MIVVSGSWMKDIKIEGVIEGKNGLVIVFLWIVVF